MVGLKAFGDEIYTISQGNNKPQEKIETWHDRGHRAFDTGDGRLRNFGDTGEIVLGNTFLFPKTAEKKAHDLLGFVFFDSNTQCRTLGLEFFDGVGCRRRS